jgi:sulfur relay (sulfurtransferase) DsrC/TusE family protein
MNVHGLWGVLKKDKDFFEYFPDIFHKRNPPREYFWKVYSVLRKNDWTKSVQSQIQKMKDANIIKSDRFKLTQEAQSIFDKFDDSNKLDLLCKIKSKTQGRSQKNSQFDIQRTRTHV